MKFLVQRYEPPQRALGRGIWRDLEPLSVWEAQDSGAAFAAAVLNNDTESLAQTSYRVLPYEGGATFNVGVHIDAEDH